MNRMEQLFFIERGRVEWRDIPRPDALVAEPQKLVIQR
jgi:hypothetical protein